MQASKRGPVLGKVHLAKGQISTATMYSVELPVSGVSDLAELPVSGQCVSDLAELPVLVIWQNCLYVGGVCQ